MSADRIERAGERKDWIFVLDLAESMAETIMAQQKKIKTVTWTGQGSVHSCKHGMYKSCFAGDDAPRGCSMYRFRVAGDRQEWIQQLHPTKHGKTHQIWTQ